MRPEAAVDLVGAYLRINGYFVLTDLEIHVADDGAFRTLTDVDIVAIRPPSLPGPVHYRGGEGAAECLLAGEVDPELDVATDRCDVIIGEVKRAEAALNARLRDPWVLHAVARRIGDVFGGSVDDVIDSLVATGDAITPTARVRLAAFGGHGSVAGILTIHHRHEVAWLNTTLARHRPLLEITNFSDPVPSLLAHAERLGEPLAAPVPSPAEG